MGAIGQFRKHKPSYQRRLLKKAGVKSIGEFKHQNKKQQTKTLGKIPHPKAHKGKGKGKGKGTTPQDPFATQVAADVQAKYGSAESQANQDLASQQQFESRVPGWYDQYKSDLAASQTRSEGAYDSALQTSKDQASVQSAQSKQGQDAVAQQNKSFADLTGAGPIQNNEAAQAAQARLTSQGNFTSLLGAQKGNASTYYGGLTASANQGKLAEMARQRNRTSKSKLKLSDLLKEKGAFSVQDRQALQDALDKRITEANALNLKVSTADTQAKLAADRIATTKRGQDISDANADATRQAKINQDAADKAAGVGKYAPKSKSGGKGGKGLTDSQRQKNQDTWEAVYEYVRQHKNLDKIKQGKPGTALKPGTKGTPTRIANNPRYFAVARHIFRQGGKAKNPGDRKFLRRKGIQL